jgi:hypothetical protein
MKTKMLLKMQTECFEAGNKMLFKNANRMLCECRLFENGLKMLWECK